MMACTKMENKIERYLDGELSDRAAKRLEEHLQECESCRVALAHSRALRRTLQTLPAVETPPALRGKLAQAAQALPRREPALARMSAPLMAMTGALVVCLALGSYLPGLLAEKQSPTALYEATSLSGGVAVGDATGAAQEDKTEEEIPQESTGRAKDAGAPEMANAPMMDKAPRAQDDLRIWVAVGGSVVMAAGGIVWLIRRRMA